MRLNAFSFHCLVEARHTVRKVVEIHAIIDINVTEAVVLPLKEYDS